MVGVLFVLLSDRKSGVFGWAGLFGVEGSVLGRLGSVEGRVGSVLGRVVAEPGAGEVDFGSFGYGEYVCGAYGVADDDPGNGAQGVWPGGQGGQYAPPGEKGLVYVAEPGA